MAVKLKSIKVNNFKRFAELSIDNIPEAAKLVILTGPNGCGKTSLFEAFNVWLGSIEHRVRFDQEYHMRIPSNDSSVDRQTFQKNINIEFHNNPSNREEQLKAFYIRSAYRHQSDFTTQSFEKAGSYVYQYQHLIDLETRVSDNYQYMVGETLRMVYSDDPSVKKMTVEELKDKLTLEIRAPMQELFDDLFLESIGNPMKNGTFRFRKGSIADFHYKNLSGGEKAAFDLLLDFVIKRLSFKNTVYCIDEPELHMHTRLQAKLIEVMFNLIPDQCQLWLSTHSIGMVRKAFELYSANPNQVAFIDFHGHCFDEPTKLLPKTPNRLFWQQMFHTALDDLSSLVLPKYIVFCEGRRLENCDDDPGFDADVYSTIFESDYPDVKFISLGSVKEVQKDGKTFASILKTLASGIQSWVVCDRDDSHEETLQSSKSHNIQMLHKRAIENYLWDDEILQALCTKEGLPEKFECLKNKKQEELTKHAENNGSIDDVKAISGPLYVFCKTILGLKQHGNDATEFSRLTLAKLITSKTQIYKELEGIVMRPYPNKVVQNLENQHVLNEYTVRPRESEQK